MKFLELCVNFFPIHVGENNPIEVEDHLQDEAPSRKSVEIINSDSIQQFNFYQVYKFNLKVVARDAPISLYGLIRSK